MRYSILLVVTLSIPTLAFSATIIVPDDYPTIQGAIDAAVNGDTVLVKPGTYVENINFKGKAITVKSLDGPEATVIDGNSSGSVAVFMNSEGVDSVLQGFALTNGTGTEGYMGWIHGGGIFCQYASPTITENIIAGNHITGSSHGGGMAVEYGAPTVSHCTFDGNASEGYGGGLHLDHCVDIAVVRCMFIENYCSIRGAGMYNYASDVQVIGCHFIKNRSDYRGGGVGNKDTTLDLNSCMFFGNVSNALGGGIYSFTSTLGVTNCSFNGNISYKTGVGGGAMCNYNSYAKVTNCILWGDRPDEIYLYSTGTANVNHSCIKGGWSGTGNIDEDPIFVEFEGGDLHIFYDSPCRDTGDNSAVTEPYDFEGDPRIAYGTVDMGADEFYTHLYITGDKTPGGLIDGKFIGLPGTTPVGLFIGSGILPSPMNTMWGEYWLQAPWFLLGPLGAIPSDGVMVLPTTLPPGVTVPVDIPMQALIGLNADSLSNLCVLEVR